MAAIAVELIATARRSKAHHERAQDYVGEALLESLPRESYDKPLSEFRHYGPDVSEYQKEREAKRWETVLKELREDNTRRSRN